jgi:hypothetical protein
MTEDSEGVSVTSEIGFRFLLTLQLFGAPVLGVLALTPCLLPQSNVPHSPKHSASLPCCIGVTQRYRC